MCMSPSRVAQIWLGGRSIHVQGSTGASRSDGYNCRESRCPRRGLFNKYVVCRRHREREFCYVKFSSSNRWHLLKFFVAPQLRLDSRRSHFPSIHTANANSHDTIAPPSVSSSCVQKTSRHKGMKKWNTCTSMHDGSRACHSTIHSLRMGITVERPVSHPIQYTSKGTEKIRYERQRYFYSRQHKPNPLGRTTIVNNLALCGSGRALMLLQYCGSFFSAMDKVVSPERDSFG
jgi:hypothetical protein